MTAAPRPAADVLLAPTRRTDHALARVAHRGFQISVLTSVALVFGLLSLDTHAAWLAWVKIALGATTAGEGLLLASNWRDGRRLTLWRLRRHTARPDQPSRITWAISSFVLQLLGVIWIAIGVLAASLGLRGLV
jgi:hypothetical protein